ncbi:MAG: hypothetical protein AAGF75_09200 [Cyanobacteria bacterium P01_H01_bin.130]
MGRVVLLLVGLLGVLIVVLQNLSVVLPLVVLGQPLVALPLGVWIGGAIALGVLGNGLLMLLGSGSQRSRREPELRAARPGARRGTSSRRQVVESLAEEIWEEESGVPGRESAEAAKAGDEDEWSVGGAREDAPGAERGRSPRRVREEAADEGELEEVIGGWSEPNRSRQGWDYEPEWDEDEAWVRPGTGRRPMRSRQKSPESPVSPSPSSESEEGRYKESRPEESVPDRTERSDGRTARRADDRAAGRDAGRDSEPAPQLKNFEKAGRPVQGQQSGSVYSYRYREDEDIEEGYAEEGDLEEGDAGTQGAGAGERSTPPPVASPSPAPRPLITPPPVDMPPKASPRTSPNEPPVDDAPPRPPISLRDKTLGEKSEGSKSAKRENSRRTDDRASEEVIAAPPPSRSQSRRGDRAPLNLPPESEAPPQPRREPVMDAEYRVLRPPDDDWEDFGDDRDDGDWDDW